MKDDQQSRFDLLTYVAGITGGIGAGFIVSCGICNPEHRVTVPVAIVGFTFIATGSLLAYSRRRKTKHLVHENRDA
jgi:hypothetical protein